VSITAGTARQLLQTNAGGTAAEFTSNVDIPGTLDVTGVATFDGIASHPLGTAAAPSVTFTGDTDTGFYSPGAGRIGVANNGANTVEVTAAGNVLIGGTLPGTPNISLNAAGTANFVGDIGTGLLFSSGGVGTRINADGSMSIRNDTVSTNAVLNVFKGGTAAGDIKLTLNNDGSANFGSNVLIGGTLPASPNITLSASGQVLVGTSTSVGGEQIQSHSTSSNAIGVGRFSANAFGSEISLYKSRNGTVGSNTVVQSGDNLGNIQWWGADGTGYVVGASIRTEVDGTPGTNDMPGRLVFLTTPDGSAVPVERMRIDSAGRLLVGTSSWSDSFTTAVLQGNAFDGATGPGVLAISRGLAPSSLAAGNAIGDILFTANNAGAFASIICQGDGTAGSNDYPGRLVFSTTPDGSATPVERMRINSNGIIQARNGAGDTLNLYNAVSAGFSSGFIYGVHSSTSAYTGTTSFVVYTNGNVVNTNGSYTTLSDVRLKENIVDAGSQWDDLKAIRIRNWNFKEETGHETHRQIGPIAQELEQVCPGLVFDTPDRDADGNKTGEVTKGVNQSVLYMKAVKALQEAMERIEVLEADMAALKGA
jgi:hypothetical protein